MTDSVNLSLLPSLPVDDEGPVFAEPWQAQAFANNLVQHFDRVVASTHDRQRATHRQRIVTTDVDKVPGPRSGRTLRRTNSHGELIAGVGYGGYYFAVFNEQGSAVSLCVFLRGCGQRPSIVLQTRSSTAIRTATPFATCCVMADAGLSARVDSISIPRFISASADGAGCRLR